MIPPLYRVVRALADEFGIRYVRHTTPEMSVHYGASGVLRAVLMSVCTVLQTKPPTEPEFLGLAPSGRLNISYIRRLLPRLRPNRSYELMCHPGRDDALAAKLPALRRYHDWTGELECLLDDRFRDALAAHSIRLVRFRDLDDGLA
jgi:predicted glycoside hydrolase/deacetylase ChbG (UPF0249 family)